MERKGRRRGLKVKIFPILCIYSPFQFHIIIFPEDFHLKNVPLRIRRKRKYDNFERIPRSRARMFRDKWEDLRRKIFEKRYSMELPFHCWKKDGNSLKERFFFAANTS